MRIRELVKWPALIIARLLLLALPVLISMLLLLGWLSFVSLEWLNRVHEQLDDRLPRPGWWPDV